MILEEDLIAAKERKERKTEKNPRLHFCLPVFCERAVGSPGKISAV
jgi:hypothetical protein